ncbi:MAG TPA: FAD-dependent monooxygenase [Xanthobacteraceae bacterium]|nr:FAD-dependent monooxygenase [Xanthobacteraceae bacterium]
MAAAVPALVIGGGVGGAAVAAHLAQAGRGVMLVERRHGPHDKVCGEFISGEAALYLDDLGIDLAALGAVRIRVVRLAVGRAVTTAPLPFPAFSLSRRALDEALLRAASERGARIRRGRGVRRLARIGDGWVAELDGGERLAADEVFLATGKHHLRGWRRPPGAQNDLVAFKLHWRLAREEAAELRGGVELALFPGGYAGLEPVEGGAVNLCLVVRRRRFAKLGQRWDALLDALCAASPHLDRRLAGALACCRRPLAIASIPYGYVATAGRGPWLLGDQAAVIPSFCGDGIAIALHSARLAADIYLAGGSAGEFQQQLAHDVGAQVRRATFMSRVIVHAPVQKLAAIAARIAPDIVAGIARGTRIPDERMRSAREVGRLPLALAMPARARCAALPARRRDPES